MAVVLVYALALIGARADHRTDTRSDTDANRGVVSIYGSLSKAAANVSSDRISLTLVGSWRHGK